MTSKDLNDKDIYRTGGITLPSSSPYADNTQVIENLIAKGYSDIHILERTYHGDHTDERSLFRKAALAKIAGVRERMAEATAEDSDNRDAGQKFAESFAESVKEKARSRKAPKPIPPKPAESARKPEEREARLAKLSEEFRRYWP